MSFDTLTQLSPEQQAAFVEEIEAAKRKFSSPEFEPIYRRYIKDIMQMETTTEVTGRLLIHAATDPVSWFIGVLSLGTSLALSSEIGHGIIHNAFKPLETVKRSEYLSQEKRQRNALIRPWGWHEEHNIRHHNHANIEGADGDIGFGYLRVHEGIPKKWYHRWQPFAFLFYPIAYLFMIHDTRFGTDWQLYKKLPLRLKIKNLFYSYWFKQYCLFPILGILHPLGPINMLKVFIGNALAEVFRSCTFFSLSTVSHHTEAAKMLPPGFKPKNKAEYYIMQIETSHNVISDSLARYNLGVLLINQIEHHLFPSAPPPLLDLIQPEIKRICKRYGIQYNESSLWEANKSLYRRLKRYAV